MPVPMPAVVVLIFCKTVLISGAPDPNAGFTGWQDREWDYEHSQITCKRQQVELTDPAADSGAAARKPYNQQSCNRTGLNLGATWDAQHPNSKYRFYRSACPVPIVREDTGEIIDWHIPPCGNGPGHGTMVCENDITL